VYYYLPHLNHIIANSEKSFPWLPVPIVIDQILNKLTAVMIGPKFYFQVSMEATFPSLRYHGLNVVDSSTETKKGD
jgi:hypothetical protein